MEYPYIVKNDWNDPTTYSVTDWKELIKNLLIQELLNKSIFLVTWDPVENSYGQDFENKYEIHIDKKWYLVSEIPVVTIEDIEIIISEFGCDLLSVVYNIDEAENKFLMVNKAMQYRNDFNFESPLPFVDANVFFTAYDGYTMVFG